MRQTSKVEGTKIAQAAKDLNVTSVTIRRYLAEFNIETTADFSGIKVLPDAAVEELKEIRRLKEEGITNPAVLEILEEKRKQRGASTGPSSPISEQEDEPEEKPVRRKQAKPEPPADVIEEAAQENDSAIAINEVEVEASPNGEIEAEGEGEATSGNQRPKHTLTCQTCSKTFEHMNPRLRDCLDCYRTKRKERRRGGDKHKNVIQHPIAARLVADKNAQQNGLAANGSPTPGNGNSHANENEQPMPFVPATMASIARPAVRNYRKAIEETRQITGSLKRRLERPDLPEGDRRWLEQIYAYQLILHQGWRHLSDYKNAGQQQEEPSKV